jgi:hypothetical protein
VVLTKEGRKLCVWMPESEYLRLKAESLETRRPVSEIVTEAVVFRRESAKPEREARSRERA